MMERAARRYRDSRFRSPPPRRRIRDGEYEEDRRLHARGVSGSVTSESERFRGIGYRHDGYRDEQLQRLSQFNESLLPRDSPSLKFQWNRLLVEKPSYTNANGGPSFGLNNGPADERGYPETSRYADSGAISMENQMSLTISTYPKDMAASKCYGGIDSSSKKEDIQYQDYSGFDNIHTIHREEEKSRVGLSEAPLYARPITGPNFYTTSEMVMPPTQRIGLDDNDRTQIVNSPRNSELQLRDLTDQMPVQPSPVDDIDGLFMYPEVRQGERSDVGTLPNDAFCKKKESILEGYTHLNSLRHTTVDGMDDIDVSLDDMREQHDCLHSSQKHYLGECIASRSIEHDEEVMGSRSIHLEYATEVHIDQDSRQLDKDYCYKRDVSRLMQDVEVGLYMAKETQIHVSSENIHKGKYSIVKKPGRRHKSKSKLSYNCDASTNLHFMSSADECQTAKDISNAYENQLRSSNQELSMQMRSSRCVRSPVRDVRSNRVRFSVSDVRSNRVGSPVRDLRKRLGPLGAARHSSKHIQSTSRDLKNRLGPLGPALTVSYPQIRKRNQKRQRNLVGSNGVLHVEQGDSSEAKEKCAKTHEPLEDSEEFKHLVHSSFLKFVKLLNENPAQWRKYLELKGEWTLKCSICGSDSEEFVDTISLVRHTFMFRSAGSRAEHLGFHKALCVLMEWNSAVDPSSSWVQLVLPYAEASAVKEDLIIWPPVVIIYNSSTASNNLDDLMIVSPQELEDTLRGIGFGGGKTKVCRGKPVNHSILVVTFQGTFSGLQEAERLHKFYAENNHGRSELENITGNTMSKEKQILSTDERESPLYGCLGIAEDLDKLDFETKKRSVVKSKKEILAIADTSLNCKIH